MSENVQSPKLKGQAGTVGDFWRFLSAVSCGEDHCVLIGGEEKDRELFFGPLTGLEIWHQFDSDLVRFEQLLAKIGIFSSVSDAKRNGFSGNIPSGMTCFRVGKKPPKAITILRVVKD